MTDDSLRIEIGAAGERLDAIVADAAGCSRARARALMDAGHVRVDGRRVGTRDKGRKPESGSVVEIDVAARALDRLHPAPDAPLDVVARGAGWIVVDKPAGLAVHPLRADEGDSLLQRVVSRHPEIEGVGEAGLRSGVVHRLDVDTSGCQAFATDDASFQRLRAAFREHAVDKVYRALVVGEPAEHGEVTLDLVVARHRPARVRAHAADEGPDGSRRCSTRWRRLETFPDAGASLVEVRPRSGFLHQVRVTFAWLGHPLLGDALYGDGRGAARHMLHASALRVGDVDAAAADPPDFAACLARLRRD